MEYQYDLFISFKNSTEKGLTVDGEVAKQFFLALQENQFNVFFSNATLTDKGIANYMLEIQNALEGAKAILVVYSDINYISQGWVAQEWMTFLNILMKDPQRNIYIYSIKKDTTELPPFLRPYECFTDFQHALLHLTNGLHAQGHTRSASEKTKREFLNAYWGLFGNTDMHELINATMIDPFYNHQVYCQKSRYLSGGDEEAYVTALQNIVDNTDNPLAAHLLSRYYRDAKHLDLKYSNQLSQNAYLSFMKKVALCPEGGEIALVILSDKKEYDGAFYMCDIVHDVLDAYDVKSSILIVDPNSDYNKDLTAYRRIVLFWSDVCLEYKNDFVETIRTLGNKVLIALNSFGSSVLPESLRNYEIFDNNNTDITKICRTLLS